MKTFSSLLLVVALMGCSERHKAARAMDCSGEVADVSRLTEAEKRELAMADEANAGRVGRGIALAVGTVLGAAIGIPVASYGTDVVTQPQLGWPHVYVGCGEVATCYPEDGCSRADWMKPSSLPNLMAKSAKDPYEMLGISECAEPPRTEKTGDLAWNLHVCGEVARCWVVKDSREYECLRGKLPPPDVAPPLEPT